MIIKLFLLSCFIALAFMLLSRKITLKWVKRSFQMYSTAFIITALLIGVVYVKENKAMFTRDSVDAGTNIVKPTEKLISQYEIQGAVHLEAPHNEQLPELPRGCEVTSLSMLLQYSGVDVKKMELAKRVASDDTPYQVKENKVHFGNPNNGFVGDMYSFDNPGLGVYHKPIADLAAQYISMERVYDFSGSHFSEIINQLNQSRPVWVIINSEYSKLPSEFFTTWQTEDGPIDITMKEHSVLITGYDHEYIYFNDPLNRREKAPINEFKAAWIQMGKQAITVL